MGEHVLKTTDAMQNTQDRDPIVSNMFLNTVAIVDADTIKHVEKLDREGWEEIDIKYTSEHEKAVSDMLLELGEDSFYVYCYNTTNVEKTSSISTMEEKSRQAKKVNIYEAIGEEYYNACLNYYSHLLFATFQKEQNIIKKSKGVKFTEKKTINNDVVIMEDDQNDRTETESKPKTATQLKKEKQAIKDAKKTKKEQQTSTLKKEDQMRLANAIQKVKELFEIIRDTENKGDGDNLSLEKNTKKLDEIPNLLINNKVLEIKGLTWLLFGCILAKNVPAYTTEKNLPVALSMITGMIRFVDACRKNGQLITGVSVANKSKRCEISHTLLDQIKQWITYLIPNYETGHTGVYPYNGITICNVARHLLATSDFPNAIPSHGVVPRSFQRKVMEECAKYYDKGFFFGLNPTIGVGKTSSVLSYAKFMSMLRQHSPKEKHFAIYSCDTDAVRKQVGVYCYNAQMPFAVATVSRDHNLGKFKVNVVPNRNCPSEDDAVIIICDTFTTKLYLDYLKSFEYEKFRNCTLLLDEPTNGADIEGSAMLDNVCEILTLLPPRTMLITATLPKFEDLPKIIDNVLEKNYNCEIKTITSDEVQIGCSVYTMDKLYITPFSGCKTKESIRYAINVVNSNPFLSRLCTIEVVMMLWEKMRDTGISDLEDLNKTFSNPQNMIPSAVHKTCIRYLEKLASQPNEIIEMVCSSKILTKENTIKQKEEDDDSEALFTFESEEKVDIITNPIDYYELATKISTKFKSQTLVAVGDPVQFCNLHFGKLYRDVVNSPASANDETKGKFGSIKNAVRRYNSALTAYKAKRESLEKNTKGSDNKSKVLQDYDDLKPTLNFPKFGVINSKEHALKYGCGEKIKTGYERRAFTVDEVDVINMQTEDWIVTLLCCGIGIYAENNPALCSTYKSTVNKLGASGRLSFVIGDDTICYGTNWPFTCVIVDDSFLNIIAVLQNKTQVPVKRSINTIMQLLGRAGRYLKSWEAIAYVVDEIGSMIISYSQNKDYPQNEAFNMEKTFEKKLQEYYLNLEKYHKEDHSNDKKQQAKQFGGISVAKPKEIIHKDIVYDEKDEDEEDERLKKIPKKCVFTSSVSLISSVTTTSATETKDIPIVKSMSSVTAMTTVTTVSSVLASIAVEELAEIVEIVQVADTVTIPPFVSEILNDSEHSEKIKPMRTTRLENRSEKQNGFTWRNNSEEPLKHPSDKQCHIKTNHNNKFDRQSDTEQTKQDGKFSRFSRTDETSTFEKSRHGNTQRDTHHRSQDDKHDKHDKHDKQKYQKQSGSKFGKARETSFDRTTVPMSDSLKSWRRDS